jgi:F-type H+-transporting ATPase subunit delta
MANETIARRYASALADVVLASGETEPVKTELAGLSMLFAGNSDLQNVFGNPAIAHSDKSKVLENILARIQPSRTTTNFLKVLQQNGRLADLPHINERFSLVIEERTGLVSANVISAREIASDEKTEFEKHLGRLTGKRVTVRYAVDESLIGGLVTRIGSTVYDDSVKTKLENLKEQLIAA